MQACGSETTILDNNDGHDLVMLGPGPSVCTSWIFRGMSTLLPSKLRQSQGRGSRGTGAAHLAGTLVCAHLEADGRVVHGGQDMVFGVVQMPSGAVSCHARLAGTFVGAHLEPNDALAHLHGGIIKVSLLLL